jgi:hypothetical protein
MLKSKVILMCLILPIIAAIGVLGFVIFRDTASQQVFSNSGYILISPENAYSDKVNSQIYFEEGSKFRTKYAEQVVFRDQQNQTIAVDTESFVHYNDNSIGALSNGVLIDLNDLDKPMMNYYGLSASSVMEKAGNGFILDNLGDSMSFQDFLWKISDTKYLLASGTISIRLSDNKVLENKDYVELTYYETGIIRIVTQEGTWQSVSSNCTAKLGNGVSINLANRTVLEKEGNVKLSLEQMVIDSDDNIVIIPDDRKNNTKEQKIPEFDIKTIDGAHGTAGEAGENGDLGESGLDGIEGEAGKKGEAGTGGTPGNPGDPGVTGATGVNGVNGPNGVSGANGAAGANGAQGSNTSQDDASTGNEKKPMLLPSFDLIDMEVKSNSVSANFSVTDEERRLDVSKPFNVQILDNLTGRQVHKVEIDPGNMSFKVEYNGLVPNNEYRIVLTADYIVDNVNYSRVFLSKLFDTDSLGLTVQKQYAADNALAMNVKTKPYAEILSANLQLTDGNGNPVNTKPINILASTAESGETIVFDGLKPNSLYRLKVVNIELNYDSNLVVPSESRGEEYWTLKLAPELGKPVVVVNKRNGCFDMQLESVTDLDGAIVTFRYDIYEVGYDQNEKLVKTLYTTKKETLPCYIDGIDIKNGYNYRLRVVAECYDNEKKVEYASALSDIFNITGNDFPTVLFEKDEVQTHHEKITGTLRINTNGAILTINPENPLTISYQNSKGDVDTYQITEVPPFQLLTDNNILYTIPFTEGNLMAADNYIISVYGTIDLNDGAGVRKRSHVGSVVVKTDTPAGLRAILTPENSQVHPISFKLGLIDADPQVSSTYEASTMEFIEVNIYNGDETAITNSRPVATYTIAGDNGNNYNSTLKGSLYGVGKSVLLTEQDFGINSATISSSKYTIEVSSVRDYTRYGNEFTVANNIRTFTKSATLPDLSTINIDDGLIVNPITLSNIAQYVTDSAILAQYDKFDANIIFGYEVRAAYFDSSTELVQSFIYYAFEENTYTHAVSSSALTFYTNTAYAAKLEKLVDSTGTVPRAVFLFGYNEASDMSRGSKIVFTYRAKLKTTNGQGEMQYYPESMENAAAVIIRSKTELAPYQVPRFNLYPWISDNTGMTWRYSVNAPDASAMVGGFYTTGAGTPSAIGNEIHVTGLNNGNAYTLKQRTRQYKLVYNDVSENILSSQYFENLHTLNTSSTSLTYKMDDTYSQNRYTIQITDSNEDNADISRVAAAKVKVYRATTGSALKTVIIPVDSVTDNLAICYLHYIDLQEFVENTLYFTIDAVYDSGVSGFGGAAGADRAIQTVPGLSKGNYISLNDSHDGISEDITGNARGSWFNITSFNNLISTMSLVYKSVLDPLYTNRTLSITNDNTGARLENLNSRPRITLKSLSDVLLYKTNSTPADTFTSFTLHAFTPTVTLNSGAAYTIDTTINSAAVHWILNGQDAQVGDWQKIDNKMYMYFDLYTISESGMETSTGRTIGTVISAGTYNYTTDISGLLPNTKYGIRIYYRNSHGISIYPIDSYRPGVDPSTIIYTFTTNGEIIITPGTPPFTYSANAYLDKYLQLNYSLNQTLGFNIEYSICKKQGANYTEVLSSSALSVRGIIQTPTVNRELMTSERLMLRPGELYWDEGGTRVYFPYNSADYYLCIKPVSKTNHTILLGQQKYVSLNVPAPKAPFYNIRAIPGQNSVTFQISVLDSSKVMVYGHYKIKALNAAGEDITPSQYKDVTYSISNPVSVTISNVQQNDRATLRLYSVYDLKNMGLYPDGSAIQDIRDVAYGSLEDQAKGYLKISYDGYPLDARGYDLGDVQIAQSSSELARIYFTNSVNLGSAIKYIQYVVINESGASTNYNEPFTLISAGTDRYYYELSHRFATRGVYQIQVRFYDENMNMLEDLVLTLYKNL